MKTRYVAQITIEAETALKVGSNASDFLIDSPVQRDWNALPMILGTSIAGVLRKDFDIDLVDDVFGNDNGSKVIFSNALLCIDQENRVKETLLLDDERSDFLKLFDTLPIREHTAITDKGVADNNSKFDEEIVYAGSRFKFSLELIESDENTFHKILGLLSSPSFRLGGGSTKGFGKFKIEEIKTESFDSESYADYSSSLNYPLRGKTIEIKKDKSTIATPNYISYRLKLEPENFFIFGSGFGDSDADLTPMYEQTIDYNRGKLSHKKILIPASSIKGALAHRSTYHYNIQNKLFIGNDEAKETIKEIFGEAKDSKNGIEGSKGKVLISDCFQDNNNETKTFDHVSIDRFTGGAIDGALFQEKTIADDRVYEIEILLEKSVNKAYINAFESALDDICTGMLALGGMTTKGHGIFDGEVYRDGEKI